MKKKNWGYFVFLFVIVGAWFIYLWILGFDFVRFITSSNTLLFGVLTIIALSILISEWVKRRIKL